MKIFPTELLEQTVSWLTLLNKDERLMIIVASARLDDLLKRLLQSTMLHDSGGDDRLFGHDRPLGSFSSRILLAYRLGLISRDYESFLQTLRRLRNDAAHAVQDINLSVSPHLDRVITLQTLASKSPLWHEFFRDEPVNPHTNPAHSLYSSLVIAVMNGEAAVLDAKPLTVDTVCCFDLMRPEWPGKSSGDATSV